MKLYEIDQAIESLIDPETGEIMDYEAFANLQMARETKIESMALWVKNLRAEAAAIKAEKNNLATREKSANSKVERLEKYLGELLGGEKFQTPKVVVSFRKSESVQLDDAFMEWAKKEADDLLRNKDPEPDKTAIKAALKAGREIEGACLAENISIQIK